MTDTLTRKIYFYQIKWIDESRKRKFKDNNFLESLLTDKFVDKSGDNNTFEVILENKNGDYPKRKENSFWVVSKNRKLDLPLKYNEKEGKPVSLGLLDDEGLYEPSHFIIFDGKIIAVEYNHQSISVTTGFSQILNKILEDKPKNGIVGVEITKILRPEAFERLNNISEIKGIKIKVATNYAKLQSSKKEEYAQMFGAAELVDDMYITLYFSVGSKRGDNRSSFSKVISTISSLIKETDVQNNVKTLKVRGRETVGSDIQDIDLLKDFFISETKVTKIDGKTKGVNEEDMFQKIVSSYSGNQSELTQYVREE